MELNRDQSEIETAKKLVRSINSLELFQPDDGEIEEIESFGNLKIKHNGHVYKSLKQLYENGFAPSSFSKENLFIRPIKNEEQTGGKRAELEEKIQDGNYVIEEEKHNRYTIDTW